MLLATIGFGEAGRAFVSGWRKSGLAGKAGIATYDIKIDVEAQRAAIVDAAAALGVECARSPGDALARRRAVFSLVTADSALEAATAAAHCIEPGAFFFDCNSCAPSTKLAAADVIGAAGGRYVDVAVLAPVHPKLHRTPLLIGGPAAEDALAILTDLDMDARIAGPRIGQASSIKMLRSVMIKGLEALTAECMLAARRAGVEEAVLASLQASDPGFDWTARSAYNLERMIVHGERRAAEMEEVARTLRDLGLPDRMASATVEWQRQIARLDLRGEPEALPERADRILARMGD